ncbi:MAG: hypothetical protein FWF24_07295 [Alphaproteobacteria bacterium]|nr:hypothetical protein [Alphaproteobacteria bacterium]
MDVKNLFRKCAIVACATATLSLASCAYHDGYYGDPYYGSSWGWWGWGSSGHHHHDHHRDGYDRIVVIDKGRNHHNDWGSKHGGGRQGHGGEHNRPPLQLGGGGHGELPQHQVLPPRNVPDQSFNRGQDRPSFPAAEGGNRGGASGRSHGRGPR